MNETVAKIVKLLFQDVEKNDEVNAIYDEVMNNCQERFEDLINRGLSEDEAIAAVVESLKGMEEVLAGYPRKAQEPDEQPGASSAPVQSALLEGMGMATFSAQQVRRVSVSLKHEDVVIEPSPDAEVHVVCNLQGESKLGMVSAVLEHGELRITRGCGEEDPIGLNAFGKKVRVELKDFSMKEFSFSGLGEMLGNLMRDFHVGFDGSDEVRVQVPAGLLLESVKAQTASGDIKADGLMVETLRLSSQSGDLWAELPAEHQVRQLEAHTTSGDLEARLTADRASMQTLSGDLRFTGQARSLTANSTSGDVTVELADSLCESCEVHSVSGDVDLTGYARAVKAGSTSGDIELTATSQTVTFSTVSGDVGMLMRGGELRRIEGHTTSGDVTINLPESMREANISLHTTSGDISQGVASVDGAPLSIAVNTVSGDIRVR